MSNPDVKQVSSVTGTFRTLPTAGSSGSPGGKVAPDNGKEMPVPVSAKADLDALAQKLNVASRTIGRDLRFEVNMDSGQSVIQVLDRETGEVIRQIPPEKTSLYRSGSGAVSLRLYDEQI